mgnify:CR=1 FL=1
MNNPPVLIMWILILVVGPLLLKFIWPWIATRLFTKFVEKGHLSKNINWINAFFSGAFIMLLLIQLFNPNLSGKNPGFWRKLLKGIMELVEIDILIAVLFGVVYGQFRKENQKIIIDIAVFLGVFLFYLFIF